MKSIILAICILFLSCTTKNKKEIKETASAVLEKNDKSDYIDEANKSLYEKAMLRLSVIEDIYKAGKNSITVTGANATTISEIKQVTDQFDDAVDLINKKEKDTPDSIAKLLIKLEVALKKTQVKEFPLLRKAYTKITSEKLWENNVKVTSQGTTINFIAGIFANNKNIKDVQEGVSEQLRVLRFKYSTYRWYDGASGTQYTMESKKDSEL